MSDISRTAGNTRMSEAVIYNGIAYLSGVLSSDLSDDIQVQTKNVLGKLDEILARAGTDKTRLLTAQIWLKNIDRDFAGMNEVWINWADPHGLPARATGEVLMASPDYLIEIVLTAAV
ncbi:RidA family protein [Paenalcaligenes niemegkensis]|uniref:RidA family protein n=1 Tax=Paenalcaligenes niemegkensis TaxID=2895469 RepID=UPI001EE92663|nr:RidA family protein [Paenalcaligenes niemegkensis]MCQ9615593.1 RidA family protein [Paenalcaligenes niemegkensis]